MSGTNRLLNNQNTKAGGNYSTLSKNLLDANNVVAKQSGKKSEKKQKKSGK